jgi:guanylate kinase
VISAPSAAGKTTLVNMLTKEFPLVARSISCTTRAPRSGEKEGEDYFFLTKKEFKAREAKGEFLEHAEVFGEYYGTSKAFVESQLRKGKHVVLVIDTQGALQLKDKIDAVSIFITAPSLSVLEERMAQRQTENKQMMEQRLIWAQHEIEMIPNYDYHIVNDHLETAYTALKSILIAEEHKVNRRK